jgi:hypothetical protein
MLVIVLQRKTTPRHRQRISKVIAAAPGALTAAPQLAGRPRSAPYVGYWPAAATYAQAQWFAIYRNRRINITIPGVVTPFVVDFNMIVDLYS